MAAETPPSDSGPPSDGELGERRKRPAPTIDLKATEMPSGADAAPAEPPAAGAREPFIPPQPERPHQHAEPGEPEPDRRGTVSSPVTPWPAVAAGVAGAGGVLAAFLVLWAVGVMPGGRQEAVDLTPRLAAIEAQLRDVAARPASPASAVDPRAIEGLSVRLDKLEAVTSASRQLAADPAVLNRIGAVDSAVKSLAENVNALVRRTDEAAAATRGRVDALAASISELQKKEHEAASDRPLRLAVASGALRGAVERGQPFAAELAAAKSLATDAASLAPLEPFAAAGVPNDAALGRELATLVQPMLKAAVPQLGANEASFLERLQTNAERLVRIRPIDAPAGDDPTAILARLEFKAARGDIAGSLADIAKLPADARAKAQPWAARVEARDKAIAASRRFNADAVAALKTP